MVSILIKMKDEDIVWPAWKHAAAGNAAGLD